MNWVHMTTEQFADFIARINNSGGKITVLSTTNYLGSIKTEDVAATYSFAPEQEKLYWQIGKRFSLAARKASDSDIIAFLYDYIGEIPVPEEAPAVKEAADDIVDEANNDPAVNQPMSFKQGE